MIFITPRGLEKSFMRFMTELLSIDLTDAVNDRNADFTDFTDFFKNILIELIRGIYMGIIP